MDLDLQKFEWMYTGRALRQARVRRKMSVIDVAKYLGISSGMYESFEKGLRSIPAEYVRTLCAFLHVSADQLFNVEGGTRMAKGDRPGCCKQPCLVPGWYGGRYGYRCSNCDTTNG